MANVPRAGFTVYVRSGSSRLALFREPRSRRSAADDVARVFGEGPGGKLPRRVSGGSGETDERA
jgi:hypothetical protein